MSIENDNENPGTDAPKPSYLKIMLAGAPSVFFLGMLLFLVMLSALGTPVASFLVNGSIFFTIILIVVVQGQYTAAKTWGDNHPSLGTLGTLRTFGILGVVFGLYSYVLNSNEHAQSQAEREVREAKELKLKEEFEKRFSDLDQTKASFIPKDLQGSWYGPDYSDKFKTKVEITSALLPIDSYKSLEKVRVIPVSDSKYVIIESYLSRDKCKGTIELPSKEELVISVDCEDYSSTYENHSYNVMKTHQCEKECSKFKKKSKKRKSCLTECDPVQYPPPKTKPKTKKKKKSKKGSCTACSLKCQRTSNYSAFVCDSMCGCR